MGLPEKRSGVGQITLAATAGAGGGDCFSREVMDRSEGCMVGECEWEILRFVGDSQCIRMVAEVLAVLGGAVGETDRGEWRLIAGGGDSLFGSTGGHPKYLQGWYRPPHIAWIRVCRSMANAGSNAEP